MAISIIKEKFTGKERDAETGLDYFGARYYSATMGRWLSSDLMGELNASTPPYNYVLNDPINRIEPEGNCDKKAAKGSDKDCEVEATGKNSFTVTGSRVGPN